MAPRAALSKALQAGAFLLCKENAPRRREKRTGARVKRLLSLSTQRARQWALVGARARPALWGYAHQLCVRQELLA